MLFIAYCVDKKDHVNLRLENRPDHVAFLKAKGDDLKLAGPCLAEDGETMIGSLLIFEAADLAAAKAWVATDPYGLAGLFESVSVKNWKYVIGGGLSL